MNQSQHVLNQHQEQSAQGTIIESKVVGVSFNNRQTIVALLQMGESVVLTREPDNRFDANAIRVEREDGTQIGYIPRLIAMWVAPLMDVSGKQLHGIVSKLTGGYYNGYMLGLQISFKLP